MHSMPEPVPSPQVQKALHEFKQAPTNEQIEAKAWQLQRLYGPDVAEEFEKTAKRLSPAAVQVEMAPAEEIHATPPPKPEQAQPEPGAEVKYRDGDGIERRYRRGGGPAQPESDAQPGGFRSFRSGDGSVKRYRRGGGPAQPEGDAVPEAALLEKAKSAIAAGHRVGRTEMVTPQTLPYVRNDESTGPYEDARDELFVGGKPMPLIRDLPGDDDELKREEFRMPRRRDTAL
jgi:hypothetical protein